jgi:hypothetical protein
MVSLDPLCLFFVNFSYADTTILMFDFKQLLKSLEVNSGAGTSAVKRANDNGKNCPNGSSSKEKSTENETIENENMVNSDSNDKVEKRNNAEENLSKQHLTRTATRKLLEGLMINLKKLHSMEFKEVLNQTSILVSNANSTQSGGKGPEAVCSSATETTYMGGILDQASSFLPGMPTQSLGLFDGPPVYMTRLSSISVTSTSTSSSGSTSTDRDRPSEVNRYDISNANAVKKGNSNKKGSHEALPKGFICPTRSEWSHSGSLAHT